MCFRESRHYHHRRRHCRRRHCPRHHRRPSAGSFRVAERSSWPSDCNAMCSAVEDFILQTRRRLLGLVLVFIRINLTIFNGTVRARVSLTSRQNVHFANTTIIQRFAIRYTGPKCHEMPILNSHNASALINRKWFHRLSSCSMRRDDSSNILGTSTTIQLISPSSRKAHTDATETDDRCASAERAINLWHFRGFLVPWCCTMCASASVTHARTRRNNAASSSEVNVTRCGEDIFYISRIRSASGIRFRNENANDLVKNPGTIEPTHRPSVRPSSSVCARAPWNWPVTLVIRHTIVL